MNISRINGWNSPHQADDEEQPIQQPLQLPVPGHHRHRAAALRARRQTARRGAGGDPEQVEAGALSDDLLMMLEEHTSSQRTEFNTINLRQSSDDGRPSDRDRREGRRDAAGNAGRMQFHAAGSARTINIMRAAKRPIRDEALLLGTWPLAHDTNLRLRGRAAAETALLGARDSLASGKEQSGTTYKILAIMREFLQMPVADRTQTTTLHTVRDSLVALIEPGKQAVPAVNRGGNASGDAPSAALLFRSGPVPRRTRTAAEETMNLLLPLLLLNLSRKRTDVECAIGVAMLSALILRGRGW
jgi:type III secretion regulatory protein HpaA